MNDTLQKLYGLSDSFFRIRTGKTDNAFYCGVELEIEDVLDFSSDVLSSHNIVIEEDGSLRNNGREFITPPATREQTNELFNCVHEYISCGPAKYTHRTSIHVHVNMLYASPAQIKNFLLLYSIFEPLFFALGGEERRDNIHCVPLSYTHMAEHYGRSLPDIVERWHKYTAFNMLPLASQGTIEFRHMRGTDDQQVFAEWLLLIEKLRFFAMEHPPLTKEMLLNLNFLKVVQASLMTPEYLQQCNQPVSFNLIDNLIDVKLAFL